MSAMVIDWLSSAALLLTLLIPFAWALSGLMRRLSGTRAAYACWLLPLVALVPPGSLPLGTVVLANPSWVVGAAPASGMASSAVESGFAWVLLVWLGGAFLFLAWVAFRQLHFQLWLRAAGMPSEKAALEGIQMQPPRALPIRLSERCATPMLVGFLPPQLWLPLDFPSRPRAEQEMALSHELAHLRHGDPWWNVLGIALRALFWFHPLVHLAWFRFRGDQELAADEAVMDSLDERERVFYARLLCRTAGLRLPSIGLGGFLVSSLKERVVMIAKADGKHIPARAGLVMALVLAVSTGLVVAATGSDVDTADSEKDEYLPVDRVDPKWPRLAFEEGTTGWVQLEATVDRDGRVLEARVVDAQPEGVFEETSVQALKQWRFPERSASEPKERTIRQTIKYRLDED